MPLVVRDAVADDESALSELWRDLPDDLHDAVRADRALAVTGAQAGDPRHRVLVAVLDGQLIGCAFLRVMAAEPLELQPAVVVSHLLVDQRFTRHGAGRGLLEAGIGWAEDQDIDRFFVAVAVNDRGTNRFLARLGLSQVAVVRGTSVASLRSRLPHGPMSTARSSKRVSRQAGQIVAARRYQRRLRSRNAAT